MASLPSRRSSQKASGSLAPGNRQPIPTMAIGSVSPTHLALSLVSSPEVPGSPPKYLARASTVGYSYARVGESLRPSHSSRSPERPTASREVRPKLVRGSRMSIS